MTGASSLSSLRSGSRAASVVALCVITLTHATGSRARRKRVQLGAPLASDGVYDRFDGDLDLGLALGAEFGSAGHAAPALRAQRPLFLDRGRVRLRAGSRPAMNRRRRCSAWASICAHCSCRVGPRATRPAPRLLDLTLDSLSLSLGAFWAQRAAHAAESSRGFDAQLGFGIPLLATAAGPWLEARGALRYPDGARREEAVILALSWHGFVTTPFSSGLRPVAGA